MDLLRLLIVAVVAITNLGLGLTVYLRNPRGASNRAFALVAVLMASWLTLAFFADQHTQTMPVALLFNRATMAASLLMGASLLHFLRVFPRKTDQADWVWRGAYAANILLAVLTVSTGLVVAGTRFTPAGSDVIGGPLQPLQAALSVLSVVWLLATQRQKLAQLVDRERTQARLVLLGTTSFAVVALTFGLLLPMVLGTYAVSGIAYFSPLLFLGFTAYGMIRHRLMDVRLVALRFAVYAGLVGGLGAFLVLVAAAARSRLAEPGSLSPDALFVGAAMIAVFVFQPLRVSLDRLTDRFLYRRTYDPRQVLRAVAAHFTTALDPQTFAAAVAAELAEGMRLTCAVVAFEESDVTRSACCGRQLPEHEIERLLHLASNDRHVLFADDPESDPEAAEALADNDLRVLVPLRSDRGALGVILLGAKESGDMYTTADEDFFDVLAPEAAIAMMNAKLYADLEHTFLGTIAALAAAADARGAGNVGQVHEVTEYSVAVAAQLGMPEGERETLRTAAMLHDIGTIGVDSELLRRPGGLSDSELAAIRSHPDIAANILAPLRFLCDVLPLVRHHHENWDGSGYPSGLAGEEIPLGARVIAVADAYYAMTSGQRDDGLGHDDAVVELFAGSGTRFDPDVVDAMLTVLARWHGHPAGGGSVTPDTKTA